MDADVLVVGAGPTGLMLATQLARWGVRVIVIDRHAGPTRETRALGVQARTLEIYAHLGIAERAVELGKRTAGANIWSNGRRAARLPLGDIGQGLSPYPYLLILGQDDNERLLGEVLRDRGGAVRWSTELVGLAQHGDHVTATLAHPDGTRGEISVAWVAGCDGAKSTVRELNGIAFVGAPYEHVFYVADTQVTGPMVPDELNVYLWPDGFHLFFPMRGTDHWRVVGILPLALRRRTGVTFEDVIPSVRHEAGAGLSFQSCTWFSTYRIHHRRAARFRDHRCFVLGDAAHIHSPVGAQGMNTGLQDAYNLSWKLALVTAGRADAVLLDSYHEERLPVATQLLNTTDRAFSLVVSDAWPAGLFRTQVVTRMFPFALRFDRFRKLAFRTISQVGINYRASRLSRTLAGVSDDAPRAGDRFPWLRLKLRADGPVEDLFGRLDDTRFNLIVIGQAAPSGGVPGLDDLLRIHEVPHDPDNAPELTRAQIPVPSYYLLRPDCYVGLAGGQFDADAVAKYVSETLHVQPQAREVKTG